MKKKLRKRINKIFESSIWKDLTITIIGVILGLFITDLYQNNQLKKKHKSALKRVWNEIKDNQIVLSDFNKHLHNKFEAYNILNNHTIDGINEIDDMKIVVHKDSINSFLKRVEPVLTKTSLEPFKKDTLRVRGYFELHIRSSVLGGKLRSSVWNVFSRQQDFLSLTDFNTIADLEQIHSRQEELNIQTNEFIKSMFNSIPSGEKERERFLLDWFRLIGNQKALLSIYNNDLSSTIKK